MADGRYSVVFTGRIIEGADPATVRGNLGRMFKVDESKVEAMFSGRPVLIKKNLDEEKANSYKAALAKAGAVVDVVADGAPPPKPAPAPTAGEAVTTPAAAQNPPQAPDLTVADVGVTLVEPVPVPPADFDTTQFDLAEVGVTLVEADPVPPANFDTSGMTLDPPGTQLTDPVPVPPAEFDTSGLSLTEQDSE